MNLWRRAVEIRIQRDTVLAGDTSFATRAIVKLLVDLNVKSIPSRRDDNEQVALDNDPGDYETPFEEVAELFELLAREIVSAEKLLEVKSGLGKVHSLEVVPAMHTSRIHEKIENLKNLKVREIITFKLTRR